MPSPLLRSISLAVVVAATAGCTRVIEPADDALPGGTPVALTRLQPEPYSYAYSSEFYQPARLVVRDAATWRTVWEKLWGRSGEVPPRPVVDFSTQVVLVAAMGERRSGGYSIVLDGAYADGGEVAVVVRSTSPGNRCGVTAALTQPVDLAILARSAGGAVRFHERAGVVDCE